MHFNTFITHTGDCLLDTAQTRNSSTNHKGQLLTI